MKKLILSGGVVVVFILYAVRLRFGDSDDRPRAITPNPTTSSQVDSQPNPTTASGSTNPPISTPTATNKKYKDGSYTGSVADAFYGNVQVKAVITGGKITDVIFLQYPNDRGTSIEINNQAMPILKQEAIVAQSAQVDGASGATQTSQAFIQSLQSALQQAM